VQVLRVEITVVHGETMLPILLRSVQLLFFRVSSTPTGRTQFADHDLASGDPNPCSDIKPWIGIILIKRLHRIQNSHSRMDRSFCIVFVGLGVPKIDQHPITHVFCQVALEPTDRLSAGV